MSSYDSWQEVIRKTEQLDRLTNGDDSSFYYMVSPSVKDDQVKWRSHFPTMLDPNFLILIYGEAWKDAGHALLEKHWSGGDAITQLLEDVSMKLGDSYAKAKDQEGFVQEETSQDDSPGGEG